MNPTSTPATATATMPILTRDQNTSIANPGLEDEFSFVSPEIAGEIEQVEMGIAPDGIDFIYDMLSDLSSNKGAYAFREVYSNAHDATAATKDMSRPIEITLIGPGEDGASIPGKMQRLMMEQGTFSMLVAVEDHGCGMSPDEIRRYFTQYGGSSKRGDADAIGSKGLGSKSPLACTELFFVESTKDGITTTATIERKRGRNSATLRSSATGKPSGTIVTIPLSDTRTFDQMRECAESIAENEIDATVILNGERTEPMFRDKVLCPRDADEGELLSSPVSAIMCDHVYLGEVDVALDGAGKPVSFRMWQSLNYLFYGVCDRIDLIIAGSRYTLPQSGRWVGPIADVIVASESGYLNFTPSRDEIKDDEAASRFASAVRGAIESLDRSRTLSRTLSALGIREISRLMYAANGIFKQGSDGTISMCSRVRSEWRFDGIDAGSFIKDGIDYSPALVEGSGTGDAAQARIVRIGPDFPGGPYALFPHNDGLRLFRDRHCLRPGHLVEDVGNLPFVGIGTAALSVDLHMPPLASDIVVVEGGCDERHARIVQHLCALCESGSLSGESENVTYVMLHEGSPFTDMDRAVLESAGAEIEYVGAEELLSHIGGKRTVKNDNGGNGSSFAERMRETYCVSPLLEERPHSIDITDPARFPKPDRGRTWWYSDYAGSGEEEDFEGYSGFDDLARRNVVVIVGDIDDAGDDIDDNTWLIGRLVVIACAMRETGALRRDIESILVLPSMPEGDIEQFRQAGGCILADLRDDAGKLPDTLVDASGDIEIAETVWEGNKENGGDKGTEPITFVSVSESAVRGSAAFSGAEPIDPVLHHMRRDMPRTMGVLAALRLMPDGYGRYKDIEPMVEKALGITHMRWMDDYLDLVFVGEMDDEAREACRLYDEIAAGTDEIFEEVPVDAFCETWYDDKAKARRLSLRKNADEMLRAVVERMCAERLRRE